MNRSTVIVALATVACGAVAAAQAEAEPLLRSETVRFADLNVNTERGAAELFERLSAAAAHVCREPTESHPSEMGPRRTECRNGAIGSAVAAIGTPAVAAVAQRHGIPAREVGNNR